MKVAVTDANIFIDLINLNIISHFFELGIELHTSAEVIDELHDHQAAVLMAFNAVQKLKIHTLSADDLEKMYEFANTKKMSDADKTVIYIAHKEKAMVLSSDGPARNFAKQKNIEVHGLVWLFDELVHKERISKKVACTKINELLATNRRYKEDIRMNEEFNKRLHNWK